MGSYPEHEKLLAIKDQSQTIGEFLDNGGYLLAKQDDFGKLYVPLESITDILARYFEIDLSVIEEEKRAMLAALQGGG